ncbi:MAG: DUF2459 domain-containing protein [Cyclobacteriaceae bacterium]
MRSKRLLFFISLPFVSIFLLILGQQTGTSTAPTSADTIEIYLVSQGWHTGLVVPNHCLPDTLWPEAHDFSEYPHLLFGWGDKDFYQNEGFNLWYGTKALLWPTPSVMQVMGLHRLTNLQYYAGETILLKISPEELNALCAYFLEEFTLSEAGYFVPLKEGLFRNSRFFAAETSYYFPKNSNVWTARALEQAGFDLSPVFHQFKGSLIRRMKQEGELVYEDQ